MPAASTTAAAASDVAHVVFALLTDAWRGHGWPRGYCFKPDPSIEVAPGMYVLACVDGRHWYFGRWSTVFGANYLIEPHRRVRLVGHITHLYAALPCLPLLDL